MSTVRGLGIWVGFLLFFVWMHNLAVDHLGAADKQGVFFGSVMLGGMVGLAELLARYRDDSVKLLFVPASHIYILLNAALAAVGLLVIAATGATTAVNGTNQIALNEWQQVLAAGVGSMAILRSSILSARIGTQEIPIGPALFLKTVLDAVDRHIDRKRGADRCQDIKRVMAGVDFNQARIALPLICLAATQNMTSEDQLAVAQQIKALSDQADKEKIGNQVAAISLGLLLSRFFGLSVLTKAVESLPAPATTTATTQASGTVAGPVAP